MMEGSGSLEQQLEATKRKAAEVRARRSDLKKIEDLGAILEEHLILDNRYTEHSTVGLAQQWDQLDQLGMRMQHNLEQQIQARNQSGMIFIRTSIAQALKNIKKYILMIIFVSM